MKRLYLLGGKLRLCHKNGGVRKSSVVRVVSLQTQDRFTIDTARRFGLTGSRDGAF